MIDEDEFSELLDDFGRNSKWGTNLDYWDINEYKRDFTEYLKYNRP